jgi:hypothetical protein
MVCYLDSLGTRYLLCRMLVPLIPCFVSSQYTSLKQLTYDNTTTMGDSELVTKHRPFHIINPDAITVRKLRAWNRSWMLALPKRVSYMLTPWTPSFLMRAISSPNMIICMPFRAIWSIVCRTVGRQGRHVYTIEWHKLPRHLGPGATTQLV